ncbi:MAG: phosphopantetheine-binding protein [Myxococcota bacterium]
MTEQEVLTQIEKLLADIADSKGEDAPKVTPDVELLNGELPIDSLDLASLVRDLEEITGHDPFADGFIEFRTAGELARLYVK